ncbi:MAG: hypothetical protein H0X66_14350 [Verrucomicrobia bacterium]|nr:hypothetical protein [Verrucomicrobiota bacterium]
MPQLLHILTKPEDALAQEIISKQRQDTNNQVEIVDVTKGEPDYKDLAQKIFAADSVQVW